MLFLDAWMFFLGTYAFVLISISQIQDPLCLPLNVVQLLLVGALEFEKHACEAACYSCGRWGPASLVWDGHLLKEASLADQYHVPGQRNEDHRQVAKFWKNTQGN